MVCRKNIVLFVVFSVLLAGCTGNTFTDAGKASVLSVSPDGGSRGAVFAEGGRIFITAPAEPVAESDSLPGKLTGGESMALSDIFCTLDAKVSAGAEGKPLPSEVKVFIVKAELLGPFWRRGVLVPGGPALWEHPWDGAQDPREDLYFEISGPFGPERLCASLEGSGALRSALLWGSEGVPGPDAPASLFPEGRRLLVIPVEIAESDRAALRLTYDVVYGPDYGDPGKSVYTRNVETFSLSGSFEAGKTFKIDLRIDLHPVSMTGGVAGWEPLRGGK